MTGAKNVLNKPLKSCCRDPITGFYRTGKCDTGPGDDGLHVVCARMTAEFLRFSRSRGNDLSTPYPEAGFPGLKPGDKWCLCGRSVEGSDGSRHGPASGLGRDAHVGAGVRVVGRVDGDMPWTGPMGTMNSRCPITCGDCRYEFKEEPTGFHVKAEAARGSVPRKTDFSPSKNFLWLTADRPSAEYG